MLRILRCILLVAIPVLASAKDATPSFSDYIVGVEHSRGAHAIDLSTPMAVKFKTVLTKGVASGPNFAGKFSIITWGCGSNCNQVAIVEVPTGKTYFPPELEYVNDAYLAPSQPNVPTFQFRPNSELLVVSGNMPPYEKAGIKYFRWHNQKLELLKFVYKSEWQQAP